MHREEDAGKRRERPKPGPRGRGRGRCSGRPHACRCRRARTPRRPSAAGEHGLHLLLWFCPSPSKNTQGPDRGCSRPHALTPSEVDKNPRVYFFPKNKSSIHKRSTKSKAVKGKCRLPSQEGSAQLPSFFIPFPASSQAGCPLSLQALAPRPKAGTSEPRGGSTELRRGARRGRHRGSRHTLCAQSPGFASRARHTGSHESHVRAAPTARVNTSCSPHWVS